jgi:hypothetical protein
MNRKKLNKLWREMASLRRSPQKAVDVENFARRLGRKKVQRGKEPTWESELGELSVLSIPHHGGRDLAPGTKNSILDQLEDDLLAWEERLEDDEVEEAGEEPENGIDTGEDNGTG